MFTHSFFLSDFAVNRDGYPEMYRIMNRYLHNGYFVIYGIEPNPSRVLENIQRAGIGDLESFIENGAFHVVERDAVYSHLRKKSESITKEQVFKKFRSIIDSVIRGSDPRRLMIYFGYPGTNYRDDDYETYLISEYAIDKFKQHPEPFEWVCCFDNYALDRMPLWQAISLINPHDKIFHADEDGDWWSPTSILPPIEMGIEKVLGEGSSILVLKTLKLVYGFDRRMIIRNPDRFEKTLEKIIGTSSDFIIKSIKNEIKNRLTLQQNVSSSN